MTHLSQKSSSRIVLTCILLLMLLFPVAVQTVTAQTTPNYFVTVNPTTPDSPMYTAVGKNWALSFEASWSYGENSGTTIQNATVTVEVKNSKNETLNTLSINTATGLFSFNYSSSTADTLTFTPTKLVTADGTEYNKNLHDEQNSIYGLQSKPVVVWWDTLDVSLVSHDTETAGDTTVTVSVTYLLLPEEGLTLPEEATYSHQTFLPKTAQDATVTINGVEAEKTSTEGTFKATVPIWLPTAYIHVEVSQEGWTPTQTGFSFAHNANKPSWEYTMIFGLALGVVALTIFFVRFRKAWGNVLSVKKNYTILGGMLLVITSFISLYWGLVGLDSTLHGFNWMLLAAAGLFSFGFGLVGALLSLKRKTQAAVIFAINLPMLTNIAGVKTSLDMYGLANPWLILIGSLALSIISAFLICNADEVFK